LNTQLAYFGGVEQNCALDDSDAHSNPYINSNTGESGKQSKITVESYKNFRKIYI
jgi:hypothetical protein